MTLPTHGKLDCKKCYKACSANIAAPHPRWLMRNDPGSWGSSEPKFLVLGFSKGSTQADIYREGTFEDVAFGGNARDRLDTLLKRIGLIAETNHVSNEINNPNSDFSFGSLVRCSLTRETKNGTHASSGDLILKSFSEVPEVLDNCMKKYLSNLPERTRLVLLSG